MTDDEFLRALEDCSLPEADFGHTAHVRAAYLYLLQNDFADALREVRRSITAFAIHHGAPGRYHETITVAYLALIQQHLWERGDGGGWANFAQRNPELLRRSLLEEFYPKSQLSSEVARQIFVLPRRCDAQ